MKNFILGNEFANTILRRISEGAPFAHAYLIYGEKGLGKKTFAYIFARTLLCTGEQKPCGVCTSCKKAINESHPDLHVYIGGDEKNAVHIDMVRQIRRDCIVKPNESTISIYLLTNIHNMTMGAFNAFLKTLEEPPVNTVFLLTSSGKEVLPETVVSRLMPIALFPIKEEQVNDYLAEHYPETDEKLRRKAAFLSSGNLGDAIHRLSNQDYVLMLEHLDSLCKAVAEKREYDMLKAFSVYEKDKSKLVLLLEEFMQVLRGVLLKKPDDPIFEQLRGNLTDRQIIRLTELLESTKAKLGTNAGFNILTANLCSRIWQTVD